MSSRAITTLALIQLGFVFGIIAATRIVLRLLRESNIGIDRPLPFFMQFADGFGLYLLLLPILWTLLATYFSQREAPTIGGLSVTALTGTALILGFAFLLFLVIVYPFIPFPGSINQAR